MKKLRKTESQEKSNDKKSTNKEEKKETKSSASVGEINALGSAESYLSVTAFSKSGLEKQLKYEKYSKKRN